MNAISSNTWRRIYIPVHCCADSSADTSQSIQTLGRRAVKTLKSICHEGFSFGLLSVGFISFYEITFFFWNNFSAWKKMYSFLIWEIELSDCIQ